MSTASQISALLPKLTEADRARVLQFIQALLQQRQGKREARNKAHSRRIQNAD